MPAWLNKGIVSWSAASVWEPMVKDDIKSRGRASAWSALRRVDIAARYFKFPTTSL